MFEFITTQSNTETTRAFFNHSAASPIPAELHLLRRGHLAMRHWHKGEVDGSEQGHSQSLGQQLACAWVRSKE